MLRTSTFLLLLVACSPTAIERECDPNACPTQRCRDGRCEEVIDVGTIGIDTGFDSSTNDAGPELPDAGPSACAAVCRDDESCFRGRCVLCEGESQVEGCACILGDTCRTGSCVDEVCEECGSADDCVAEEGVSRVCDEGMCTSCGGAREACCIDPMTSMPGLCDEGAGACGVAGRCGACGELGQTCCVGEVACTAPAMCGATGICEEEVEACGEAGAPACADGTCIDRHVAVAGLCTPCGATGQVCCPFPMIPQCISTMCSGFLCGRDGS